MLVLSITKLQHTSPCSHTLQRWQSKHNVSEASATVSHTQRLQCEKPLSCSVCHGTTPSTFSYVMLCCLHTPLTICLPVQRRAPKPHCAPPVKVPDPPAAPFLPPPPYSCSACVFSFFVPCPASLCCACPPPRCRCCCCCSRRLCCRCLPPFPGPPEYQPRAPQLPRNWRSGQCHCYLQPVRPMSADTSETWHTPGAGVYPTHQHTDAANSATPNRLPTSARLPKLTSKLRFWGSNEMLDLS